MRGLKLSKQSMIHKTVTMLPNCFLSILCLAFISTHAASYDCHECAASPHSCLVTLNAIKKANQKIKIVEKKPKKSSVTATKINKKTQNTKTQIQNADLKKSKDGYSNAMCDLQKSCINWNKSYIDVQQADEKKSAFSKTDLCIKKGQDAYDDYIQDNKCSAVTGDTAAPPMGTNPIFTSPAPPSTTTSNEPCDRNAVINRARSVGKHAFSGCLDKNTPPISAVTTKPSDYNTICKPYIMDYNCD